MSKFKKTRRQKEKTECHAQRECHAKKTRVIRRIGKRVVLDKNYHQRLCTKDVVVDKADTTEK